MTEWQTLAGPAASICIRHYLIDPDETIIGLGDDGLLEHLIHEVCHMVSLGLKGFDPAETPDLISHHLAVTKDAGIENETTVWAIEWFVWQELGMSSFEWGDIEAAADIQGCDLDDLEALVHPENEASDRIYSMALKVIEEIRRLTAAEASVGEARP